MACSLDISALVLTLVFLFCMDLGDQRRAETDLFYGAVAVANGVPNIAWSHLHLTVQLTWHQQMPSLAAPPCCAANN